MKGRNKEKILKLFDYFKMAFTLNMNHKELYKPQVFFLVLRGILIFLAGISLVEITSLMFPFIGNVTVTKFMALTWSEFKGTPLLLFFTTLLVSAFGSTYVEAGLYTMYARINSQDEGDLHFSVGANKYFFTFLIGNMVIVLFWIIASLPYILVGFLTMTLGLVWMPIVISALLMVWKAAVVSDEVGVFDAFGKSISFCRRNFWPTTVFIIIKGAVSEMSSGSGGSGNTGSFQNSFNGFENFNNGAIEPMPFSGPNFMPSFNNNSLVDLISTIITAIVALVSIISVLVGLVHMIFDIFFGITTVIIYQDDWSLPHIEPTSDPINHTKNDPMEVA